MWVGLIQSVESLNRTERMILPQIRGNFPCLTALSWDIVLFLPLDLNGNISSSWISSLQTFGLELTLCCWFSGFWPQTGMTQPSNSPADQILGL